MKVKSKKEFPPSKSLQKKTGGGPMPTMPSQEACMVEELIPLKFEEGTNDFDCDVSTLHYFLYLYQGPKRY